MLGSDTKVGVYQIRELLGAGGMGEVYRAHDTRLNRDVALKVLPDELAGDADRLARFEREAQLLASLSHPNIAALHGIEESGPIRALVMEVVEGPTLADRLTARPLRIAEALPIARQIAEAIEYAHEHRVLHRDLKPANIKVTPAGLVKVLDFGLAKALADDTGGDAGATVTAQATVPGMIVGTAAYMSPEQARGAVVTRAADIWAFGATLFEMLTGARAFPGRTASDSMAAVLEREPEWALLPRDTPPAVERLLRRCLDKDPRRRLHDIADARVEIDDALTRPAAPATGQRPRGRLSLAAAGAVIAIAAIGTALYFAPRPGPAVATRLSLTAPGTVQPQIAPEVSPDGRRVALVATDRSGRTMLWIRELDAAEPRVLDGTEDARHPFWSPDGRALGFWANGRLKRVDAAGGGVVTLADTAAPWGGSWSRDGTIVFVSRVGELARVAASGGPVTTVLKDRFMAWPRFLPGTRRFLFSASDEKGTGGAYIGSLDSTETTLVMPTRLQTAYLGTGWLLFVRGEDLMAQRFDADRLSFSGEPSLIAQGVYTVASAFRASYSASDNGVLVYTNASLLDTQLTWFDRTGRSLGAIGPPGRFSARRPQLSPDGRTVAIEHGTFGTDEDVWLHDTTDGSSSRITLHGGGFFRPAWSGDGKRLLYRVPPTGQLVTRTVEPLGAEQAIAPMAGALMDWSPDGRYVLYGTEGPSRLTEIWVRPLEGGAKPFLLVRVNSNAVQAQFSPNGRWVAYTASPSGRNEVYAVSFPEPAVTRQLSSDGAVQPRWSGDGSELFFLSIDQHMMALPILDTESLRIGAPRSLFRLTRVQAHGAQGPGLYTLYDVDAGGTRFIVNAPLDDPGPPYTVVLNWMAALPGS